MSHAGGSSRSDKSTYVNIFMMCLFLLLLSFALWLVWVTYFREFYDAGVIEVEYTGGVIGALSADGAGAKNQGFHSQAETEPSDGSISACIVCHGEYPHSESRSVRAFLNAHAYVMTCEVCHLEAKDARSLTYSWLDVSSNRVVESKKSNSRYRAIPVRRQQGEIERFDNTENLAAVRKYVKDQSRMTEAFRKAMLKETHAGVSQESTSCHQCHNTDAAPSKIYADLGYSDERASELQRIEVAGLIHKYQDFYMPSLMPEADQAR